MARACVLLLLLPALAGCIGDDEAPARARCPAIPEDVGTVLHGEVYRADGASGRGAFIEATGPYGIVMHTVTKATPCFALKVSPGDWSVVASQSGWAGEAATTVREGDAVGIAIVMQRV